VTDSGGRGQRPEASGQGPGVGGQGSSISIVIPAWRGDQAYLPAALAHVRDAAPDAEVIVATPADEAGRYAALAAEYPGVRWVGSPRGRAVQMNAGAEAAAGDWIVFLHVDSRLPSGWTAAVAAAASRPRAVGGAFRFALDAGDWQARVIEFGVRLRLALFGMPYGDQALFVRRDAFLAMGGYRDLPLMEDIDLVRRLKREGRLHFSHLPVTTSARRWERDGWFRRSATNASLAIRYLAGVSPRALARRYSARPALAIVMMARAPWIAGKTRLALRLSATDHAALRAALFEDTLEAMRGLSGAARVIACEPAWACEQLRSRVDPDVEVIAQYPGDLGARMHQAFADLFRLGAAQVILIGSDLPDLPVRVLQAAAEALGRRGDRVVLGPAEDGGYYLIGLKEPHPELFTGVEWGIGTVFVQTLARAEQAGVPVHRLEPWADVDEWRDLERLSGGTSDRAPRTREWLARLGTRQRTTPDAEYPAPSA
jgi:rSAM/selenodomain-associated transferase 2/rSAM/selenodomain-associated transferase 1